jgi:phage terminase large subunit
MSDYAAEVEVNPEVFNDVYIPKLKDKSRVQIYFGGSSSGKSVFLAQRCVIDLMNGKRNYLICRQVARTLRMSVFSEVCAVIEAWHVGEFFSINKSDFVITCVNDRQAAFVGLDDVEKLKSIRPKKGAWTDIWVEEATETEKKSITQLKKRQRGGDVNVKKRLILSFNPIYQSNWIYQEYFSRIGWADKQTEYKSEDVSILKTWYIHNKFLTPDDIKDLENETDPYYFNVYTLGNWGVLGNVIFTKWSVQDLSKMRNHFVYRRNGLDFGFADDPAALSRSHYAGTHKKIYIFGELYETGLTNDLLAEEVIKLCGDDLVTCDSAEPKSIAELKKYGVRARGARKGKDSVLHGIQWLQQQEIIVDQTCINTINELRTYKWKEDASGNALPIPVDKNNHIIDGIRYAYEDDMTESRAVVAAENPFYE